MSALWNSEISHAYAEEAREDLTDGLVHCYPEEIRDLAARISGKAGAAFDDGSLDFEESWRITWIAYEIMEIVRSKKT